MSDDLKVFRGKANNVLLESIHGKVADVFDKAIDALEARHRKHIEMAKVKAEDEGIDYEQPDFILLKEDLALLAEAQKFLKANNVEMSVVKKSGSKTFSSKINQFNKEKKDIILS